MPNKSPLTIDKSLKERFRRLKLRIMLLIFPQNTKLSGECNGCGECCTRLILVIKKKPIMKLEELEKLARTDNLYSHLHFAGRADGGEILFCCDLLDKNNRCTIHSFKPDYCQSFPQPELFQARAELPPECGYKINPRVEFKDLLMLELEQKKRKQVYLKVEGNDHIYFEKITTSKEEQQNAGR